MSSANPYSAPESAPSEGGSSGDSDLVSPLVKVSGWMMLLGVVMIIYGAFFVIGGLGMLFAGGVMILLSLFYFIFAGITLAMGIWLTQASGRLKPMHMNSPGILKEGVTKLAAVIRLQGILVLVGIIMVLVAIVIGGAGAFMAASS